MESATTHLWGEQVRRGERFEFGENWRRFLALLTSSRIAAAEASLRTMLETERLEGRRFLDVGSGSGLFSLAARRLGATVHSFDYDPASVACTRELRRRFFPADDGWTIDEGSVLDPAFTARLGRFDIVYAWGVLHHTGAMWDALAQAGALVGPGGRLFIAIYNDLGGVSRRWRAVKRLYCSGPAGRRAVSAVMVPYFTLKHFVRDCLRGANPLARYAEYEHKARGMSVWYDIHDWLGGYPYEVARPEELLRFFRQRGFSLVNMTTCGAAHGCNEFVFERPAAHA
jgi:2-polyprenyl-6-hydroxyphenyl methylase/3-demethylubiquinone-9 3-methyltransferase